MAVSTRNFAAYKAYRGLIGQVRSDAEKDRVPWQDGRESELSDSIRPLDEMLVHEIFTEGKLESSGTVATSHEELQTKETDTRMAIETVEGDFVRFKSSLHTEFFDARLRRGAQPGLRVE
ncbi:hypothetical protein F4778DRAFT_775397 [Xylariomycetidae sp. FL2044]|nr:hypothetical protein F4778DRAFT_775397 [Xylariomycetidae sp. FL2044]